MPFASEAQRRKFYATPSLHKFIPEFEASTPAGAKLPMRVRHKTGSRKRYRDGSLGRALGGST